jgi:hypothetical protein
MSNPVAQIVENYTFQRYIEPTTGGYFYDQPPGDPIVSLTKKKWAAGRGHGIMNAGTSQSPVAIRLFGKVGSATIILRPGEAIYPGEFDSFEYGLPFGWPGGGVVMLKVALSKDVRFEVPNVRPEIPYWRVILKVQALAAGPALPGLTRNWPSKFPWQYALGQSSKNQYGTPSIHVEPTRTLLFLPSAGVNAGLAVATTYAARLYFRTDTSSDEMGQGDYQTDVEWTTGVADGALAPTGAVVELAAELDRLDLNDGGVTMTCPDASLETGDWCVAVRYGRI